MKIRKPTANPALNGVAVEAAQAQSIVLAPLAVSGVVLTKEALIAALRVFAPVVNVEVDDSGNRFILTIEAPTDSAPVG